MKMQCPRCHNSDAKKIFYVNGQYYCRQCISFQRVFIDEKRQTRRKEYPKEDSHYHLDFELSKAQQKISDQLIQNYQNHLDSLVLAVCGSGKTEIVFGLIEYALSLGDRVCFCIPRKELVKELYQRMKTAFSEVEIGLLYGGHIENPQAQFVICTMHQLYRFENDVGFHLMIADEVDAFPFYQNKVLNEIFHQCCLQNYVKMSATFSLDKVHHEELLIMNRRYHGYDLPVPKAIYSPQFLQKYILKYLLQSMKKKTIVYVPTIAHVEQLVSFLKKFLHVAGVSSLCLNNQQTVEKLKQGQLDVIVSTTLLERGMTIEDVQVIVYEGQHALFDERTLIQMAGRVGRKPQHPDGKVYILTTERTKGITKCIQTIKRLNQMSV